MFWTVAFVKANWEKLAARQLRRAGFETYLPVVRTKYRKRALMFPRYIFIRIKKGGWHAAQRVRGVVRIFLRNETEPTILPKDFVKGLKARENKNGIVDLGMSAKGFEPGQTLRVIRGQFERLLAVYQRSVAHGEEALVDILGRQTRVVFKPDQLSSDLAA